MTNKFYWTPGLFYLFRYFHRTKNIIVLYHSNSAVFSKVIKWHSDNFSHAVQTIVINNYSVSSTVWFAPISLSRIIVALYLYSLQQLDKVVPRIILRYRYLLIKRLVLDTVENGHCFWMYRRRSIILDYCTLSTRAMAAMTVWCESILYLVYYVVIGSYGSEFGEQTSIILNEIPGVIVQNN